MVFQAVSSWGRGLGHSGSRMRSPNLRQGQGGAMGVRVGRGLRFGRRSLEAMSQLRSYDWWVGSCELEERSVREL